jgi:hypothetical protein
MRALLWILAGIGIGLGAALLLSREPEPESAVQNDEAERTTQKTYGWGTKTLVGGKVPS